MVFACVYACVHMSMHACEGCYVCDCVHGSVRVHVLCLRRGQQGWHNCLFGIAGIEAASACTLYTLVHTRVYMFVQTHVLRISVQMSIRVSTHVFTQVYTLVYTHVVTGLHTDVVVDMHTDIQLRMRLHMADRQMSPFPYTDQGHAQYLPKFLAGWFTTASMPTLVSSVIARSMCPRS